MVVLGEIPLMAQLAQQAIILRFIFHLLARLSLKHMAEEVGAVANTTVPLTAVEAVELEVVVQQAAQMLEVMEEARLFKA